MARGLAAFLGAILSLATIDAFAAKGIPLPRPAPLPKIRIAPVEPPPSPVVSDIPRPPASIPFPSGSTPVPPASLPSGPPPAASAPILAPEPSASVPLPPASAGIPLPPIRPPQTANTAPEPQVPPPAATPSQPQAAPPAQPPAARPAPVQSATTNPPILLTPRLPSRPSNANVVDNEQRVLVDRVSAYLSSVRTLIGDFVQVGPNGNRTVGQLYLQKPGRVRFEYEPPSPIELIADGSSMVVRDRKLATQDLYPLGQTPLRFLLADRVDLLRDTNVVGATADDVFVTVVIEEKQMLGGTHRLVLMFDAKDLTLRQWTITDPQGFDTTVAVYNLDLTKKPDPSLFKINYERVLQ